MTVTVRIEPNGREFEAGPHETLLEAALRAGVPVPYRCAGGTCGNCRARIVSGAVGETRFHDYVLDARAVGQMLLCCSTAATDVEDIPQQEIITRVSKMDMLSPEVMRLHLRTPRSQTLCFLAGQYVTLEIPGLPPRSKSIASCPCNATHLEFHIRRAPGDAFSEFVFSKLRLQQSVVLRGPHGRFTFDEDCLRPIDQEPDRACPQDRIQPPHASLLAGAGRHEPLPRQLLSVTGRWHGKHPLYRAHRASGQHRRHIRHAGRRAADREGLSGSE
jgi:CDP-4-dehydro-6-deoxyglucose reductase